MPHTVEALLLEPAPHCKLCEGSQSTVYEWRCTSASTATAVAVKIYKTAVLHREISAVCFPPQQLLSSLYLHLYHSVTLSPVLSVLSAPGTHVITQLHHSAFSQLKQINCASWPWYCCPLGAIQSLSTGKCGGLVMPLARSDLLSVLQARGPMSTHAVCIFMIQAIAGMCNSQVIPWLQSSVPCMSLLWG